jgi:tetratricopeptide (TPR) repeat protein
LCISHVFDEAIEQSRKTLEMDPHFAVGHYELGQALEQRQMHDEAIAEFQKAIEISGHSGVFDSSLAHAFAVSGRQQEAKNIAKDLESRNDQNPSAEANIAGLPGPVPLSDLPINGSGSNKITPMSELERQTILNAIAQLNGDKLKAARMLGIGKTTLYRKLKEYAARS